MSSFLNLFKSRRAGRGLSSDTAQLLSRALGMQESGRLSEAAAEFRSILALHPGHWESLNALAAIALRSRDYEVAIRLYSEIIEHSRNNAEAYYKRANALNSLGNSDGALADYDRAIKIDPQYAHAWCNRGAVLERLDRWNDALQSYDRALDIEPEDALAHYNRAAVLKTLGRFEESLASYERAIASRPDYADAYINRGGILRELRRFAAAVASYDKALELVVAAGPAGLAYHGRGIALAELTRYEEAVASFDGALQHHALDHVVHTSRGLALKKLGLLEDALVAFDRALALKDDHVEGHFYRGQVLQEMRRFDEALSSYDRAIQLTPKTLSPYLAHASRGFALAALRRFDEALACFERAVALNAEYAEAHLARGHVLQELGRHVEAVDCYDAAIALEPDGLKAFPAHCAKAFVLKDLKRLEEAVATYDRAIELKADDPDVHMNRACVLQELGCHEDAIPGFERAIALNPAFVEAFQGRGFSLLNRGRHELAIASFDQAISLKADHKYLSGFRRYVQMQICEWDGSDAYLGQLENDLRASKPVSAPFQVLALVDSPELQRLAAEIWVREEFPPDDSLGALAARKPSTRIRVGYFSADFRNHPVSLLAAELFETHDRSRFEIIAFAYGPRVQDAVRARLEASFDTFLDVSEKSDREVTELARRLEIDIAVDLGGFTEFARPKVFALRAAPIQVSYIGYLGTMGAPYMDYLLADPTIVAAGEQQYYAEKIIYLPSYQVNDSKRPAAGPALTRAELGLPAADFVYSCFNANYKITPATFGRWMRILARVDASCLFLYAGNETAERNLRKEASARGVDPARIVFGRYLPQADYLARFRAMDLFLDTLPYNAGTTASDALWSGLPVLTLAGRGFAGRVASSLLSAMGLPELIASTAEQYEDTAVRLATDPGELQAIRRKLADNRLTTALFDTPAFTRHIEAAYVQAHQRHCSGLPPDTIVVTPSVG